VCLESTGSAEVLAFPDPEPAGVKKNRQYLPLLLMVDVGEDHATELDLVLGVHAADLVARFVGVTATSVEFLEFGLSIGIDDGLFHFAEAHCIGGSLKNLRGETGVCLLVRRGILWTAGRLFRRSLLCSFAQRFRH